MLPQLIVKEKYVKFLTIIHKEVDWEDDQKTVVGIVYKQILMNSKLQIGKGGKKRNVQENINKEDEGLHWTAVPFTKKKMLFVGDGRGYWLQLRLMFEVKL